MGNIGGEGGGLHPGTLRGLPDRRRTAAVTPRSRPTFGWKVPQVPHFRATSYP
jgi:hypothetical protein